MESIVTFIMSLGIVALILSLIGLLCGFLPNHVQKELEKMLGIIVIGAVAIAFVLWLGFAGANALAF